MRGLRLNRHHNLTFEEIFEAYKLQVYNQVYIIAKSEYAAEEITQEIFIKLWMNKEALNNVNNLGGYLYTIARNYSLNYLRKAASDTRLVNELMRVATTSSNSTEASIALAECRQLVSNAVNKLSPQRQLVYKLSKEEGLNHDEIAQHLNLSKNTVKNHLMAALRFIDEFLRENGVNPAILFIIASIILKSL